MLFGGAVLVWIANTLASVLRGSGNTLAPALALAGAAADADPAFRRVDARLGPVPAVGHRRNGGLLRSRVRAGELRHGGAGLDWRAAAAAQALAARRRLFRDILRVGAISSISALQTVLTAVILTGFVARFGTAALAGYGVGVRLELLQIPIVFAIGQALVVMVGTNIGAGQAARAKRIAWTGTAAAMLVCLAIGWTVAAYPPLWIRIFSDDAAVLEIGSLYMRVVAPFYPFLGAAVALYFASQGSGQVLMPVLAGTARLLLVAAGGVLVMQLGGPLAALFAVIALGLAVFGGLTGYVVHKARWARQAGPETLRPGSRSAHPTLHREPRPSANGRKPQCGRFSIFQSC